MRASTEAIAKHLDLSAARVRDLIRGGVLRTGMSLDEARITYIRHLRERAAGRVGVGEDGETLDPAAENAKLARAKTDAQEMQNAVKRRELLPAAEAEAVLIETASTVRERLIALPSKVAPLVAGEADVVACETIVTEHVHEVLSELAALGAALQVAAEPGGASNSGVGAHVDAPAAAQDAERVGGSRAGAQPRKQRRARKVANKPR